MTTPEQCDHVIRPMVEGMSASVVRRCRCGQYRVPPASKEENDAYAEGLRLTRELCTAKLTKPEDQRLLGELIQTVRREWELKVTRELQAAR